MATATEPKVRLNFLFASVVFLHKTQKNYKNKVNINYLFDSLKIKNISVLPYENDNDIEMKAYKDEYDNYIKVELEQDNIEQNFDNSKKKKSK
ncbi:hypothetical protein C1645_822198 [Glomus cerebriforme]|uniref:Uncharacterized protein n=1 Tax=Glomus cerebriforme TaxID=658196 RepID=A0A397T586_9GLOM|nr:hypothetical protein C1645_822198 [Glomus cerebriforme]